MTGAQLWEMLGNADEADVRLPVAVMVVPGVHEGIERRDSPNGPLLCVKVSTMLLFDPAASR